MSTNAHKDAAKLRRKTAKAERRAAAMLRPDGTIMSRRERRIRNSLTRMNRKYDGLRGFKPFNEADVRGQVETPYVHPLSDRERAQLVAFKGSKTVMGCYSRTKAEAEMKRRKAEKLSGSDFAALGAGTLDIDTVTGRVAHTPVPEGQDSGVGQTIAKPSPLTASQKRSLEKMANFTELYGSGTVTGRTQAADPKLSQAPSRGPLGGDHDAERRERNRARALKAAATRKANKAAK